MITINGLLSTPFQSWRTVIDQGTVSFSLRYMPAVQMWFIDVSFLTVNLTGLRVNSNINILDQYCNIIPFGLYCEAIGGIEPNLIDDFSTGKFRLNILTQEELEQIEDARQMAKIL